ncbi:VOC family protein [Timonella sp. A28]|uniref:VOC family protein n=1 Tax=Timonella sp. A28 TaxID=3442640 RepID=UPI003EB83253
MTTHNNPTTTQAAAHNTARVPQAHPLKNADLLPGGLTMDAVTLYVRDIDAMVKFYTEVITLEVINTNNPSAAHDQRHGIVTLGRGKTPIVVLRHEPNLPPAQPRQAGLFHTAILFTTQSALAAVVASVAQHARHLYTGSADHLVSQAFYLNDPEGNGIELYWDRPRNEWSWTGAHVVMDTLWLDPNTFVNEHLTTQALENLNTAPATVGHVHLQVGETQAAQDFYVNALGFETTSKIPGALFVAAGGYHHHMAVNTWNSRGAGPRISSLGLAEVSLILPTNDDVHALQDRLNYAHITHAHTGAALTFTDPWNNHIAVSTHEQ